MSYLYTIETALLSLFDRIDEGEVSAEDAADTVEALELEYEAAIDGAATRVKELLANAEAIKAEIETLMARRTAKVEQAERYRQLILESLRRLDKTKVETPRNCVAIRRNPPKVVIENEAVFIDWARHLAPDLLTRNETYKPNRDAIKDAIEHGEAVPDVHIEQGESLRIK
ncbi:MAG: siphovirus Gp157 family protein [Clostridia bacterium]|nr:siphovirus Gp157 family protein [Clostridia bacterium]